MTDYKDRKRATDIQIQLDDDFCKAHVDFRVHDKQGRPFHVHIVVIQDGENLEFARVLVEGVEVCKVPLWGK